ncbi:hypothetical protein BN1708_006238 [Verticillium longisporum]|uniref:Uncharacterized protein n=1 Tax=Verticillium longisporum TaxID=100787 RepID=A0A0G4MI57_VERLO|nr:hypothetical protein BN1708_006238 [Verticillium longisporum]
MGLTSPRTHVAKEPRRRNPRSTALCAARSSSRISTSTSHTRYPPSPDVARAASPSRPAPPRRPAWSPRPAYLGSPLAVVAAGIVVGFRDVEHQGLE